MRQDDVTIAPHGEVEGELRPGLKQRHLSMIAIGGVIGAGLFVGSGAVMNTAGPASFITYAATGVLIVLIMRMLGEMAAANPVTGSFAEYARIALGDWAGFSVAWLYWYFWVIVVGFEAIAGAGLCQKWIDAPTWLLALILMVAMTATNLWSVGSYGEFEYWFAAIKVVTIVIFLVVGLLFILGFWPGAHLDFSNLTSHGGFFPNGVPIIFSSVVIVIFAMTGAEIATIAAAESADPRRGVTKAVNSVVWRIGIFYVGSVFLICTMIPWDSPRLGESPYVAAFERLGIPYAADIMNAVVLTAVLSCLNSGLYTASRMLWVLGKQREAPAFVLKTSRRGVPFWTIILSSIVGFLSVIAAALWPKSVFLFLLNSSGAVIIFVYILIAISQIILRRRTPDAELPVKMWLFPVLSIAAVIAMVAVLVSMFWQGGDNRAQVLASLLSWAVLLVAFVAMRKMQKPYETGGASTSDYSDEFSHERNP